MNKTPDDLPVRIRAMGATCFALQARKTANLLARIYSRAMASIGLEIAQFSTLCVVAAEQSLSVSEMAMQLGIDRSTLVRNLKILERDQLIAQSGREGRRVIYRLTDKGKTLLVQALPLWEQIQTMLSETLGEEQADDLRRSLSALRKAARRLTPETTANS
jgi:DNA-binding MarR family transcriptional regulator